MAGHNGEDRGKVLRQTIFLGTLTAFASMSIDMYLPALPTIARDLQTTTADAQQTLSVFFLGMACGQLAWGPLSDRFGRKPPLLVGLALYIAASAGCALSGSVAQLICFRLLQALGGCAGVVIARAIVRDRYAPTQAAQMFSQLMLVMGVAPILAPFVGGQLLLFSGWRAIFWVLVLFGTICLVIAAFRLQESPHQVKIPAHPGAVARNFYAILRDRSFIGPAMVAGLGQAAMFAYITTSPAVFIERFGVPPDRYGFVFAATAIALIGSAQINARLLVRISPARMLSRASVVVAGTGLFVALACWSGVGGMWSVAAGLVSMLASMGFVVANAGACALAGQGERAGSAAALLGTLQFLLAAISGTLVSFLETLSFTADPTRAMGTGILLFTMAAFLWQRWLPALPPRRMVLPSSR